MTSEGRIPDPAGLAALHAEAFAAPWSARAFADLLGQAGVFALAEADGFILIRVVADEAEILTLAVRPAARRQGVGARLLGRAAVEAARRGAVQLFLEVAEDNVAARALYAAAGFGEVGRRRGYYAAAGDENGDQRRIDALLLRIDLSPALP